MPDPDDRSEQLDADKLGDDPFRDDASGAGDYPPDRSLGVEDPSLYGDDDLATRAELRRDVGGAGGSDEMSLVDPYPAGVRDLDETLTGAAVESPSPPPAEEAAIHVVDAAAADDGAAEDAGA